MGTDGAAQQPAATWETDQEYAIRIAGKFARRLDLGGVLVATIVGIVGAVQLMIAMGEEDAVLGALALSTVFSAFAIYALSAFGAHMLRLTLVGVDRLGRRT